MLERCRNERNCSPAVRVLNGFSIYRSPLRTLRSLLSRRPDLPPSVHNYQLHPSYAASHPPLRGSRVACRIVQYLRAGPDENVWWITDRFNFEDFVRKSRVLRSKKLFEKINFSREIWKSIKNYAFKIYSIWIINCYTLKKWIKLIIQYSVKKKYKKN